MLALTINSGHLIQKGSSIKFALNQLNMLSNDLTLFVVDENYRLVGTLTDGDVRRALINDMKMDESIDNVMFHNFAYLRVGQFSIEDIAKIREKKIGLVPVIDDNFQIRRIVNLNHLKSVLPLDVVIMAGGEGRRLRPLTVNTPKPLLVVGTKPIIEHNIDRLVAYGIENINISLKYLGSKIIDYLGNGESKSINISYVTEENALGTIGALSLIKKFAYEYVLIMNSDLLTDIDFEDFFIEFLSTGADMAVATIPYKVDVPYAVLETNGQHITSFKEKPTYTYYSNAGIYLIKREIIDMIPKNDFFNATDLMEALISQGKKTISYPLLGYWLDIGKHDDFRRAQEDIKHVKF